MEAVALGALKAAIASYADVQLRAIQFDFRRIAARPR